MSRSFVHFVLFDFVSRGVNRARKFTKRLLKSTGEIGLRFNALIYIEGELSTQIQQSATTITQLKIGLTALLNDISEHFTSHISKHIIDSKMQLQFFSY